MLKPIVLMGAGMALVPLVQKLKEWLKARHVGEKGDDGGSSKGGVGKGKGRGGVDKGKGKAGTADAGMKRPPGAAARVDQVSSMPRSGKMASNKKNRARKAEKRAETTAKREQDAAAAAKQSAKGGGGGKGGEVIQKGNNVPKDEDIVGGEAGKTFTTTSHVKVPTWYAKVREERGNQ